MCVSSKTLCILLRRALLEAEGVQQSKQADVEEQLSSMRQSLQEQSKAAQSLHSELSAQLEAIQSQVAQVRTSTFLFGPFKMSARLRSC